MELTLDSGRFHFESYDCAFNNLLCYNLWGNILITFKNIEKNYDNFWNYGGSLLQHLHYLLIVNFTKLIVFFVKIITNTI